MIRSPPCGWFAQSLLGVRQRESGELLRFSCEKVGEQHLTLEPGGYEPVVSATRKCFHVSQLSLYAVNIPFVVAVVVVVGCGRN